MILAGEVAETEGRCEETRDGWDQDADVKDSKLKFKTFIKEKNKHYYGHMVCYFRLILFPSDTDSETVTLDFMVDLFIF